MTWPWFVAALVALASFWMWATMASARLRIVLNLAIGALAIGYAFWNPAHNYHFAVGAVVCFVDAYRLWLKPAPAW